MIMLGIFFFLIILIIKYLQNHKYLPRETVFIDKKGFDLYIIII